MARRTICCFGNLMEQSGNKEYGQHPPGIQQPPTEYAHIPMAPAYQPIYPGEMPQYAAMPQYAQMQIPAPAYAESPIAQSPPVGYSAPSQAPENPQPAATKGKRRSKNDLEGRIYKCTHCDRTYLSYPALYTHIKTKHSLPGETPSLTNGRGRGRPKKNIVREDRPDPTSPLFFRTEDKKGGPTAVIYGFEESYRTLFSENNKYLSFERHPLYAELYKLHVLNVKTTLYEAEHPGVLEISKPPPGFAPAFCDPKLIVTEKPPLATTGGIPNSEQVPPPPALIPAIPLLPGSQTVGAVPSGKRISMVSLLAYSGIRAQ